MPETIKAAAGSELLGTTERRAAGTIRARPMPDIRMKDKATRLAPVVRAVRPPVRASKVRPPPPALELAAEARAKAQGSPRLRVRLAPASTQPVAKLERVAANSRRMGKTRDKPRGPAVQ